MNSLTARRYTLCLVGLLAGASVFAACEDDEGGVAAVADAGGDRPADAPADGGDAAGASDTRDGGDAGDAAPAALPGPMSTALSGVVATRFVGTPDLPAATDIKQLIQARIAQLATGTLPASVDFPLPLAATDSVRVLAGLRSNVVMKWMDPLGFDNSAKGSVFGANPDYLAFIPDEWGTFPADTALWSAKGKSTRGWLWVNHEYISNVQPSAMSAPTGQALQLAAYLKQIRVLIGDPMSSMWQTPDLDSFVVWHKKMLGGSWLRVLQDSSTGEWAVDRGARNTRFDATSSTLFKITGQPWSATEKADDGMPLPAAVLPGTAGNCSGGTTPWGTIFSGEENVQGYYGDIESCWDSNQKFVPKMGCDSGAAIALNRAPARPADLGFYPSTENGRHARDSLGWLVEVDVGQAPGEYEGKTMPGVGHKKIGAMGRARWENATFATGPDFKLVEGKPIVVYAGDDRRGGRIWKFVSNNPWTAALTRAQTRALLDEGSLYAAHFSNLDNATGDKLVGGAEPTPAAPGQGRWVKIALDSTDVAPNAMALGMPARTVGDALKDMSWNKMGGYASNQDVLATLFTAAAKVGVMELNRPEDLEYNPRDPSGTPRIYVAFTNHTGGTQLDQNGVVRDPPPAPPAMGPPNRADKVGSIFALEEADPANPGSSGTFKFFVVWRGSVSATDVFAAASPDNLVVDKDGDVWFGTDGNFAVQRDNPMANTGRAHSDSYYYLNLRPDPAGAVMPLQGKAFRFISVPSDAEATGPAFTPDLKTFFSSVQHPGEEVASTWPMATK